MTLGELYRKAVEAGIKVDPRGKKGIERVLKEEKKTYQALKGVEKDIFDTERLSNPYADTRILVGDSDTEINSLLVGIDMEVGEVLLAHAINQSGGQRVDAILSHHPEGRAYASFYRVMGVQADILNRFGVPINVAEGMLAPRMQEVARKVMPANHNRAVDAARLLGIAMLCCHTVADNHVADYLQKLFDKKKPTTVGDTIDLLLTIPEYRKAAADGAGPTVLNGKKDNRAGKIFVDMTGGTEGSKDALGKLVEAGVGTLVGMHLSEDHRKEAEKHFLNVVIAGHIASDNLGVNLLLDNILDGADYQVLACSGFQRITRKG